MNIYTGDLTKETCIGTALVVGLSSGSSLAAQFVIGLDRFTALILSYDISNAAYFTWYFLLVGIVFSTILFQMFSSTGFTPMESTAWCFMPFTSLKDDDHVRAIISIVFCLTVTSIVVMAYTLIYFKAFHAHKKVKDMQQSAGSAKVFISGKDIGKESNKDMTKLSAKGNNKQNVKRNNDGEFSTRKVFFRCVLFLSAFLMCYGPPFMTFVYKVASKNSIPPWLEMLTGLLGALDPLILSILILSGPDYKLALRKLLNH
jgi:hypothetical protein